VTSASDLLGGGVLDLPALDLADPTGADERRGGKLLHDPVLQETEDRQEQGLERKE
jgi:hypothetical protein